MTLHPLDQRDPRLRQVCAPLTKADLRRNDQQLEIEALLNFVYGRTSTHDQGGIGLEPRTVGLSANQVGIMKQISIVDLAIGHRGYHDVHVLVNPRVLWRSRRLVERTEGCVNFDTWWGTTRRPMRLKVVAWDRSGNLLQLDVTGWAAAMLEHEIDHLNGRLFIDRLATIGEVDVVSQEDYLAYRRHKKGVWPKKFDAGAYIKPIVDAKDSSIIE